MKKDEMNKNLVNRLHDFNQGLQSLGNLSGFAAINTKQPKKRNDGYFGYHVVLFASVYKEIQLYALRANVKVKDVIRSIISNLRYDEDIAVYTLSPYHQEPMAEAIRHNGRPPKKDDSKVFLITIDKESLDKVKSMVKTCKFIAPEGNQVQGQIKHLLNYGMIRFLGQHK